MMKILLFITAASTLCSPSPLPPRQFGFVNTLKNWTEALRFCRDNFTDLVTISSLEETTALNSMVDLNTMLSSHEDLKHRAWIGFFDDVNTWRWSISDPNLIQDGEASFMNWGTGEPNNWMGAENCAAMAVTGYWVDVRCEKSIKPICCEALGQNVSFILIEQIMTWSEGQRFCRERHTDLARVRTASENDQIKGLMQSAGEVQVWIGLYRNSWTWVDGSNSTFRHWKTPEPDGAQEDCAAAALGEDGRWEDRPCSWKLPFFCYRVSASKHVLKLKLLKTSSLDLSDTFVLEDLLKQLKQKLRDSRLDGNAKLTWSDRSEGKIFHKDE